MFNPSELVRLMPALQKIDTEADKFFQLLKDKNIEPKTLQDLERVTRFFDETYDTIEKELMKEPNIPEPLKKAVVARMTLDFFGRIGETFNLPLDSIPMYMGEQNLKKFKKAIDNVII